MTFPETLAARDAAEAAYEAAGLRLGAIVSGHRLPNGKTPDHIRARPDWQEARRDVERCHLRLRAINATLTRTHAKAYRAHREAERASRLAALGRGRA